MRVSVTSLGCTPGPHLGTHGHKVARACFVCNYTSPFTFSAGEWVKPTVAAMVALARGLGGLIAKIDGVIQYQRGEEGVPLSIRQGKKRGST